MPATEADIRSSLRILPASLFGAACAAVLLAVWFGGSALQRRSVEAEVRERVAFLADARMQVLGSRCGVIREDALFLASLPPLRGMVAAAAHGGFDPEDGTPLALRAKRLESIFLAFARTDSEIAQLSLVGIGNSAFVEVERRRGAIRAGGPRSVRRGDDPFLRSVLRLRPGEVAVSDLEFEREPGRESIPLLRGGTPVPDEGGGVFGIAVASLDARPVLDEFRRGLPDGYVPFLAREGGDFLCHPDRGREFGSRSGRRFGWEAEFGGAPPPVDTVLRLPPAPGSKEPRIAAIRWFRPDPGRPEIRLVAAVVASDTLVRSRTARSARASVVVAACVLLAAGLFVHLFLVGARRSILAERTRSRLGAIVDGSADAIIGQKLSGIVASWNRSARDMTGVEPEDALGRPLRDVLRPAPQAELVDRLRERLLREGGSPACRVRLDGPRGPVDVSVRVSPVAGPDGSVDGFATILRDVTREEEALAADRAKSEFVSHMSHEIRTPLSAVLGLAQLLERRSSEPGVLDLVGRIGRAGGALRKLLDDILDLSRIEAGRLEIERSEFRLGEVLEDVGAILASSAQGKDIDLSVFAPPAGAELVLGDPNRLRQVLLNLATNAVKFTNRGSVSVSASLRPLGPRTGRLEFRVRDTGIGLPADRIGSLFDPFVQAEASTSRRFGGSGLGLAISRRLVEAMGGSIEARSEPGSGTEFRFSVEIGLLPAPPPPGGPVLEVLVADDRPESREAIASVAGSLGWKVNSVASGPEAVQAVLDRVDAGSPLDVVVLDRGMPDLDGLMTAAALNARLDGRPRPVVVLATAAGDDIASLPESALLDAIVPKPVSASALKAAVERVLRERKGAVEPPPAASPTRGPRLSGTRILVADDNQINRELLEGILRDEGASVETAIDGAHALASLEAAETAFDAVLMDVRMPGMDGCQTARRVREDPRWADLPLIALSAGVLRAEREAVFEAGMSAFIPKPFQLDSLVRTVRELVAQSGPSGRKPPEGGSGACATNQA